MDDDYSENEEMQGMNISNNKIYWCQLKTRRNE